MCRTYKCIIAAELLNILGREVGGGWLGLEYVPPCNFPSQLRLPDDHLSIVLANV